MSEVKSSITSSSSVASSDTGAEAQACCPTPPHFGCSVPPASTESVNAHTTNADTRDRLTIGFSPVEVVDGRSGRVPAVQPDYTPQLLADLNHFRTLLKTNQLGDAAELCRERQLTASDETTSLIWTKELGIVRRAEKSYDAALDLHLSVYSIAQRTRGTLRGTFENGFGRTFELLGRYDAAFEHYTAARYFHEQDGHSINCAGVDNNTGRLFIARRMPEQSHFYFDRAASIAETFGDVRLQAEINESRALAYETQGDLMKAIRAARLSVDALYGSDELITLVESWATHDRIAEKLKGLVSKCVSPDGSA